jgi:hypothetical protein
VTRGALVQLDVGLLNNRGERFALLAGESAEAWPERPENCADPSFDPSLTNNISQSLPRRSRALTSWCCNAGMLCASLYTGITTDELIMRLDASAV